jgi:hypothetical protein
MAYDFSALNDKEFEELVRDILSIKLKIDFQSFKNGRDKGIDLRYACSNSENEVIVQVKHFLESGFTKLKSVLKKQEAEKVKLLNPSRYIFVTSLPLSPQNKEEVKSIFSPYIHSTSDVLDKQSLNDFLRNNSAVIDRHFKLWLSDTGVLKRILRNGIKGRSEFFEQNIKNKIKIFVPSKTHQLAVKILNKRNFILITGAPGIGKTTIANILTYQFLAEGFELVYVREIREAEDLYVPEKKQIFYFDDFLGAITLDLKSSRNADSAIVSFTERVKSDIQKKLILTCRTTILNQAKQESEAIDHSKIELSNYEVTIDNYRDIEKARILYNHIYFSNLSEDLRAVFFKDKFYWKVIKHAHYNPRIIQFFTDIDRLQPRVDYSQEVLDFLNDPSKIWEKSYSKQISYEARLFLSTLYSLGGRYVIGEAKLKEAFEARLDYEVANNNFIKTPTIFSKVVNELIGGFINRIHKTTEKYTSIEYKFMNPSIEDFLCSYFNQNKSEYFVILKSAIYFEQFKERIATIFKEDSKRIYFEPGDLAQLMKVFNDRLPKLTRGIDSKELETAIVLIRHFPWKDIRKRVIKIMNAYDPIILTWDDRDNLIEILDFIGKNRIIEEFKLSFEDVFLALSESMTYHFQIQDLSRLISSHEIYRNILDGLMSDDEDFSEKIHRNIDQSWSKSWDHFISQTPNLNSTTNKDNLVDLIQRRKDEAKRMNSWFSIRPPDFIDRYSFDYDTQINKTTLIKSQKETEIKNIQGPNDGSNEIIEINRLFNSDNDDKDLESDLPF